MTRPRWPVGLTHSQKLGLTYREGEYRAEYLEGSRKQRMLFELAREIYRLPIQFRVATLESFTPTLREALKQEIRELQEKDGVL